MVRPQPFISPKLCPKFSIGIIFLKQFNNVIQGLLVHSLCTTFRHNYTDKNRKTYQSCKDELYCIHRAKTSSCSIVHYRWADRSLRPKSRVWTYFLFVNELWLFEQHCPLWSGQLAINDFFNQTQIFELVINNEYPSCITILPLTLIRLLPPMIWRKEW